MDKTTLEAMLLGAVVGAALLALGVMACQPRRGASRYALAFVATLGAIAASDLLEVLGLYAGSALADTFLAPLVRAAAFVIAPAAFLYIRASLEPQTQGERRSLLGHAVPVTMVWATFQALALFPWWAEPLGAHLYLAYWAAFLLQSGCYLVLAVRAMLRHLNGLKAIVSTIPDASVARLRRFWVLTALAVATLAVQFALARFVEIGDTGEVAGAALRVCAVIAIFALLVVDTGVGDAVASRTASGPQDGGDRGSAADVAVSPSTHQAGSATPYARSPMGAEEAARLRARLEEVFARDALHRDPLLTLNTVARRMRIAEHRLSQLLNTQLGVTFFDYVNAKRIDEARTLLLSEPDRTILDVSLAVGFNARSTFYNAFRKHAGTTPTAFRSALGAAPLRPRAST